MSARARVKEADIMRALRAAKKVGAKRVIIGPDGSIDIRFDEPDEEGAPTAEAPPEEVGSLW